MDGVSFLRNHGNGLPARGVSKIIYEAALSLDKVGNLSKGGGGRARERAGGAKGE